MRGVRRFLPPLAALAMVFAAGLTTFAILRDVPDMPMARAASGGPKPAAAAAPLSISEVAPVDSRALLERPLFSPSRRPHEIAQAPIEAPEAEPSPPAEVLAEAPPTLAYHGFLERGGNRSALVSVPPDPAQRWINLGAEISGWTLEQIGADSLEFRNGEERITIKLDE